MAGDELSDLIARARAEMPEIPDAAWHRFEAIVRDDAGGRRIYIRANRKTVHFEQLAQLDGTRMYEYERAAQMQISARHLRNLRCLFR